MPNFKIDKEEIQTGPSETEITTIPESNFWDDFENEIQHYNREVEEKEPEKKSFLAPPKVVLPEQAKENNDEFSTGIVELVNSCIAFVIAKFLVGGGDTENYMINKESESRISKAIARILPTDNFYGSPWFTVIILIGVSYVPVLNKAAEDRKELKLKRELEIAKHKKLLKEIEE